MTGAKGRFITIEGVEGVGKSTNLVRVTDTLDRHGIEYVTTREPGGTELSEKIRDLLLDRNDTSMDPVTELLLMFAARVQHVAELIKPALDSGTWVICDRFTDSTYAYQGGGRGIDKRLIEQLEADALGGFAPDLTILLDLPVEVGMARAKERGEYDRFEQEGNAFFERVRQAFLERAGRDSRFRTIDASADLATVSAAVVNVIEQEISRLD